MALRIRFAENFAANLQAIQEFLLDRHPLEAASQFARLLEDVEQAATLVAEHPYIGRPASFLSSKNDRVATARRRLERLVSDAGVRELREYVLHGRLVLYAVRPEEEVIFLAIRAQRQDRYSL